MEKMMLHVIFLFVVILCCKCDYFIFNYHLFDTDDNCTTASWNYIITTTRCIPVTYSVQGFDREDVIMSYFNAPRVEFNITSPSINFPTSIFVEEEVYFRIVGINADNVPCAMSEFLNFTTILKDGMQISCRLPQDTPSCLTIPSHSSTRVPFAIWPRSTYPFDDYCYCLTNAGTFSQCTTFCQSIYNVTLNGATLCLQNHTSMSEGVKIFIVDSIDRLCHTMPCSISSLITSLWIKPQSACGHVDEAGLPPIVQQNYTVNINGTLNISVSHAFRLTDSHSLSSWRHGSFVLRNPRATVINDNLVIEEVVPSDAGHYTVLLSDEFGCHHIQFDVFVEFLVIESPNPILVADTNNTIYSCVAMGYPYVQLLMWQSGTGQVIPQAKYNTSLEAHDFNTTVTSKLVVDEESCGQARGYACVFNNGKLPTYSLSIECIPGAPSEPILSVAYSQDHLDINFCIETYSNSLYPVEYDINITTSLQQVFNYNSQCITLNFMDTGVFCSPITVSITVGNSLGDSTKTDTIAIDSPLCRNFLARDFSIFQIRLHGVLSCIEWTTVSITNKTRAFVEELVKHVQLYCACNFSVGHIYQPNFECFDTSQDHVTWRAYLISYSDIYTSDMLIDAIEQWVSSTSLVSILGERFEIDRQCPVLITSLSTPECQNKMSVSLDLVTIISLCVIITLLIVIFLVCCLAWQICKRIRFDSKQGSATERTYEQIEVPVYEEIPPQKEVAGEMSYTPCEAYDVIKKDPPQREVAGEMSYTPCEAYEVIKKVSSDATTNPDSEDIMISKCAAYAHTTC